VRIFGYNKSKSVPCSLRKRGGGENNISGAQKIILSK
jgi:hypothetical protein